jgi:hypothetical protein
MSILIGKSSDALSSFEVTNQTPAFDSFRNTQRSIDKSGQIYQFREKGSFDLEFNYMTDAQYQDVSHILRNRNSLRDGLVFQPIPYAGSASSILTLDGSINKAYKMVDVSSDPMTHNLTGTEFSGGDYTAVSAYNSSKVEMPAAPLVFGGFLLRFSLAAFFSAFSHKELRRLTLVIHGMETSPVRFAIYDQVNAAWYPIDDRYSYNNDLTAPAFNLYRQLVAQVSTPWGMNTLYDNFAADNTVWFMIVAGSQNEAMLLQYARLFVNGYWVAEEESGNFEKFSVAFTGAGRTGTLRLIEL